MSIALLVYREVNSLGIYYSLAKGPTDAVEARA
jgi:hypothetical protein